MACPRQKTADIAGLASVAVRGAELLCLTRRWLVETYWGKLEISHTLGSGFKIVQKNRYAWSFEFVQSRSNAVQILEDEFFLVQCG
jgi:hypothetical protein